MMVFCGGNLAQMEIFLVTVYFGVFSYVYYDGILWRKISANGKLLKDTEKVKEE
jgi:hypothetical protein